MKERYPRLSVNVVPIGQTENTITQRETWNVSIGDLQHVAFTIRYVKASDREIGYEITEGYGRGIMGTIAFKDHPDGTLVGADVPLLDVHALLFPQADDMRSDLLRYLLWQDAYFLEGKFDFFRDGQMCPFCKKGILKKLMGSTDGDATGDMKLDEENFECNLCGEQRSNMIISVKDGVEVRG